MAVILLTLGFYFLYPIILIGIQKMEGDAAVAKATQGTIGSTLLIVL